MSPLRRVLWIATLVVPVAAGLFRVWVHQSAVQLGYELSQETQSRRSLRETERELEVELAAERAPARLVELAQKLGLGRPVPEQLLGRKSGAPR